MKKIILFGAAAAALIATPTLAQQDRAGGAGVTRAQIQARVQQAFARVDVNRDGFVTQAEAQSVQGAASGERRANRGERRAERRESRDARFAQLDANRDGQISRAEFFAPRQGAERGERREIRADRRAERLERRAKRGNRGGMMARLTGRRFDRVDANNDGRISLAEMTTLRLRAFDRADANRDGRLTREERRSVREARQARRG